MLELVTEEHKMISSAVETAFSHLMEADRALFFKDESRIDASKVRVCLDELGLFEQLDVEAPLASSRVQGLIAYEAGKANLPFPLIESLSSAFLFSHSQASNSDFSRSVWTQPSLEVEPGELIKFEGKTITGTAKAVPFVSLAENVVLLTQNGSGSVFVVADTNAAVVQKRHCVETDYPVADLTFVGAPAVAIALREDAGDCVDTAMVELNNALIAAAEIAGSSAQLFEMTKDYLMAREQFGAPLAVHQALKHRMAEHYVSIRSLEMLINYAAAALDARSNEAASLVHAAKSLAGTVGKDTAEDMLQLHGAIAYTTEYPLHLYLRRILRLTTSFGSTYEQNERLFQEFQRSQMTSAIQP